MNRFLTHKSFRFDEFCLNTTERTLLKNGNEIEVPSKTFDVLQLLVKKYGNTVTKEHLFEIVWNGRFVEENNITVHIARLRKLLGASKTNPFIKTVTGRGYKFVALVDSLEDLSKNFDVSETDQLLANQNGSQNEFNSIAVLPLKNENGDEEIDYLADGLTESLINSLSYMPDFRVLARDSVFPFKDKEVNTQEVGKKLGVSAVLTGRLRVIKGKLIIGVELVNVSDGTQIWGTQVNQVISDIFEMQEKITLAISERLRVKSSDIVKSSLPQKLFENAESYRLYLNGKYLLAKRSPDDLNKAIQVLQQSINHDSNNVLAYVSLADSYFWLYMYDCITHEDILPIVSELLQVATEINPEIPALYLSKGRIEKYIKWDVKQAEEYFAKAIGLNPNYAEAYHSYAYLLLICDRFSESVDNIEKVENLSPLSVLNSKNIARLYYCMGEYEKSLLKLDEVFEADPDDYVGHSILGAVLAELGEYNKAIEAYQKTLDMQYHYENVAMKGYVYGLSGDKSEAKQILYNLETESKEAYLPAIYKGVIYSGLEDVDNTFKCLEEAFEIKETDLMTLKIDPRWKSIRRDKRYFDLLKRMGLPTD